jgi:hypothetical protein
MAGGKVNPLATELALAPFESTIAVRLPDDLRVMLRAADSMPLSDWGGLFRLLSLAEFLRLVDPIPAKRAHTIGFADPKRYYYFTHYTLTAAWIGDSQVGAPAAAAVAGRRQPATCTNKKTLTRILVSV